MAVCAAGDEVVAHAGELLCKGLGVGDDLLLVELVFGGEGLLEGDSEGGDSVVVGSTLVAGEDTVGHVSGFSVGRVLWGRECT